MKNTPENLVKAGYFSPYVGGEMPLGAVGLPYTSFAEGDDGPGDVSDLGLVVVSGQVIDILLAHFSPPLGFLGLSQYGERHLGQVFGFSGERGHHWQPQRVQVSWVMRVGLAGMIDTLPNGFDVLYILMESSRKRPPDFGAPHGRGNLPISHVSPIGRPKTQRLNQFRSVGRVGNEEGNS